VGTPCRREGPNTVLTPYLTPKPMDTGVLSGQFYVRNANVSKRVDVTGRRQT